MKLSRSHLLTIVYALFSILYTIYLSQYKLGWFYLRFLLISGYLYFILQGVLLRSKNWGIVLLLPLATLLAAILLGYVLLFILRLGGGTLLDRNGPDMILLTLLFLTLNFYSLRFMKAKGVKGRKKR